MQLAAVMPLPDEGLRTAVDVCPDVLAESPWTLPDDVLEALLRQPLMGVLERFERQRFSPQLLADAVEAAGPVVGLQACGVRLGQFDPALDDVQVCLDVIGRARAAGSPVPQIVGTLLAVHGHGSLVPAGLLTERVRGWIAAAAGGDALEQMLTAVALGDTALTGLQFDCALAGLAHDPDVAARLSERTREVLGRELGLGRPVDVALRRSRGRAVVASGMPAVQLLVDCASAAGFAAAFAEALPFRTGAGPLMLTRLGATRAAATFPSLVAVDPPAGAPDPRLLGLRLGDLTEQVGPDLAATVRERVGDRPAAFWAALLRLEASALAAGHEMTVGELLQAARRTV